MAVLAILVLGYGLFTGSNALRMSAAANLMRRAPSEFSLGVTVRWNERCKSFVAVSFWQRGPSVPERQGYICGGVTTPATLEVVPFDEGLVPGLPHV